jgi:L-arabinose isomerase
VGILPLYLKLYDETVPDLKPKLEVFLKKLINKFKKEGISILEAPVCREKEEFDKAVKNFENEAIDAIVTIHLAYSPSLESVGALAKTDLPIIIFDTTPKYDFGENPSQNDIMMNHGIHGVQDLCNLLKRNGKYYSLVTGYWEKKEVFGKVVKRIDSACIASNISRSRVGTIGGYFKGMGDFVAGEGKIKELIGTKIIRTNAKDIVKMLPGEGDKEVNQELEKDRNFFELRDVEEKSHIDSIRVGIAIRNWIRDKNLTGFTMNFSKITHRTSFPTIPFLEASKAMARGTGYAGEGDVITSALVGSLLKLYPDTTFTEMFCPDWKNETIFLSHMGEMNINLTKGKPLLITKEIPFIDIDDPVVAFGQFKKGDATFVNLAPSKESFNLIVSPVRMLEKDIGNLSDTVTGWFKPCIPLEDFLFEFSDNGGTHHSALVYGDAIEEITEFGKIMGFGVLKI